MENKKISEYAAFVVIVLIIGILAWEFTTRDVRLCRTILTGLVNGSITVAKYIDWDQFQAAGVDVGINYSKLKTDQEKENYRNTFIKHFASGFKAAKGNLYKFTNWAVAERKGTKVVVAARYLVYNKTILFKLSKLPRTRLVTIEWMH